MVDPVEQSKTQTTTTMPDYTDPSNNSSTAAQVTINLSPIEIPQPSQDSAPAAAAAPTNNSRHRRNASAASSLLSPSAVNSTSLHLEDLRSKTLVAKPLNHEDAQAMGPTKRLWNNFRVSVMGEYNDNNLPGNVDSDEREGGLVGEQGMRMYRVHHANNMSDRGCCGVSIWNL